jgi:hypothetical protein
MKFGNLKTLGYAFKGRIVKRENKVPAISHEVVTIVAWMYRVHPL